jgi:signal transduction histidine kinase
LGILGMKERALFLGGELTIRGIKGEGTTVTLNVPIQKSSQSEV